MLNENSVACLIELLGDKFAPFIVLIYEHRYSLEARRPRYRLTMSYFHVIEKYARMYIERGIEAPDLPLGFDRPPPGMLEAQSNSTYRAEEPLRDASFRTAWRESDGEIESLSYGEERDYGHAESRKRERGKISLGLLLFLLTVALVAAVFLAYTEHALPAFSEPNISGINSAWVGLFFDAVNSKRLNLTLQPLNYCPALSDFARLRTATMLNGTNWMIAHYGFEQDLDSWLNSTGEYFDFPSGQLLFAEQVYGFTSYEAPKDFLQELKERAPVHYEGLFDPGLKYYGFFVSKGPVVVITVPAGYSGPAEAFPGENLSTLPGSTVKQGLWIVVEMSNACLQTNQT